MTDSEPCAFCGATEMSNAVVRTDPTVQYHDGPAPAGIPRTVLCYECASEVSAYLQARSDTPGDDPEKRLSSSAVESLLELVREDRQLMLEPDGRHYVFGIRYVDGGWVVAETPAPEPPRTRSVPRAEAADLVREAGRVIVTSVDHAGWKRFSEPTEA